MTQFVHEKALPVGLITPLGPVPKDLDKADDRILIGAQCHHLP